MDPKIFKAYDIRGIYPNEINDHDGYKIARAYVEVIKPKGPVVVGFDVRIHSKEIAQSVIKGLNDSGRDVIAVGLISTEMMYFAVGSLQAAGGVQVTASHNPARYHGMKLVRHGAEPISGETGLSDIKQGAMAGKFAPSAKQGTLMERDILEDYVNYVLTWIDTAAIKPMKLVYNPNFGFEGKVLEALVERGKLPLELIPLNENPDGTFPKGRPDPFVPENRPEFVELVKSSGADLGVAWDADADRVFFCADGGLFVEPYYTNLLLIEQILSKHPGEKIVYDPRTWWATIDIVKKLKGVPILERVGHSYIKARMRKENAVFSGESSGHTYFRDFWFCDNGMIPLVLILELLSKTGKKLSELVKSYMEKYPISGEVNSTVTDVPAILKKIEAKYSDAKIDHFDGLSVEFNDWRFNLRPSNTEPLLRLNVEAKSKALVEKKTKELLELIRS